MRIPLIAMAASISALSAQAPTGSILHVEIEKSTLYSQGYCAPADRAQNPNKLPRAPVASFITGVGIGDIVSVNGQAVKGTAVETTNGAGIRPNLTPGTPIGDFPANATASSWELAFMNLDGTAIGTVHIHGNGGGPVAMDPPPPGAPKEFTHSSYTVTGGTGAFFGVRGYWDAPQDSVSGERRTTDCEDPAYRRINADAGGNKRHGILWLVSPVQPQVLITGNTPAVVHSSDGTPVSTAKPARAGEILTLYASGLGPTRPGVDPGQTFTVDPPQVVNSPVQVLVNGNPGDVLYAGGYPGAVDGYQVNFRVPDNAMPGQAALQLTSAWIAGPAVNIPIQ